MNMAEAMVGILGGGQLGRMQVQAGQKMGIESVVLEKEPNCPAAQVGAKQIVGSLYDREAIFQLAETVGRGGVLTWEVELFDTYAADDLVDRGYTVYPSPTSLREVIMDKWNQKEAFSHAGIPVAPYMKVESQADLDKAREGGKVIIKSRRGGYDGRSNLVVPNQDWEQIREHFSGLTPPVPEDGLLAENIVEFDRELAMMAARDIKGQIAFYPLVETIHVDNICHLVMAPAERSKLKEVRAQEIFREFLRLVDGPGVFGLELFDADELTVNEACMRVHNSGHYTKQACETSQFAQHMGLVLGHDVASTRLLTPATMINLLGRGTDPIPMDQVEQVRKMPNTTVDLYGKEPKPARKIGDIIVTGDIEWSRPQAELARSMIDV